MPYGHFAVSYVKPLIIGRHIDTAQSYGTSIGLPIIINGFVQGTIGGKILYHSVSDLFPLTYMCVDIDFRFFSDQKKLKRLIWDLKNMW